MLFSSPHPPIWIPRSRPLRIGRSAKADLTLSSRQISRIHAELRFEGDRVVIEDLASTNGTFVNGDMLDHHPVPLETPAPGAAGGCAPEEAFR